MPYYGFSGVGVVIVLLSMFLGAVAQSNLRSTFLKFSKKRSTTDLTGAEVAKKIMEKNGVTDVKIELASGYLGDHYDPQNKVVRLSKENYYSSSIAAQAVAAHEVGHVLQHAENSSLLKIRTAIFPLAQFGSQISGPLIIFGLISSTGAVSPLLWLGILGLTFGLLFQLATLPVEFDASARALKQLQSNQIVGSELITDSRSVLKAAAWTYVVGAMVALLQIIRLVLIARNRD